MRSFILLGSLLFTSCLLSNEVDAAESIEGNPTETQWDTLHTEVTSCVMKGVMKLDTTGLTKRTMGMAFTIIRTCCIRKVVPHELFNKLKEGDARNVRDESLVCNWEYYE